MWLLCEKLKKEDWFYFEINELPLQEWNAPRPMHVALLEGALQRQTVSEECMLINSWL